MALHYKIKEACKKKQILKIIIGLDNFNLSDTVTKVQAAERAGATYVDIAANVEILQEIQAISSLPVCVSSIDIEELFNCSKAGADMLEIGNFDIFYSKGITFSKTQVFNLARDLKNKLPQASICVTIPHKLSLQNQIILAKMLEDLGIDLIQTEGCSSQRYTNNHLVNSISNASSALSSTYVFAKYIKTPIISSSGIHPLTAPMAISYGASGIGIGSFFNSCSSPLLRSKNIGSLVYSMQNSLSLNYEILDFFIKKTSCDSFSRSEQDKLYFNQVKLTNTYIPSRYNFNENKVK
uniref:hypothetical protein n=1 Tax=Rhodochorton tenue TaxID=173034 RepID=UPI002A83653C|nr:hypothetical protein UYM82_pgp023 [Rhodochorton tenue]WOK79552.1 hypothetical protein [Rhodochorton tenue]